ncbi:hypothetical protein PG993_003866 [Apiospora rasikravindrae]|uniref:Uncharacterized protein n=1 Tax=Apiospora rasikravindrae TaxID=990691 RepID=A0ABR1U0Q4_9PEZI
MHLGLYHQHLALKNPILGKQYSEGDVLNLKYGDRVEFEFQNQTGSRLYATILYFSASFGVFQIWPSNTRYEEVGLQGRIKIRFNWDVKDVKPHLSNIHETLRVVASPVPTSFLPLVTSEIEQDSEGYSNLSAPDSGSAKEPLLDMLSELDSPLKQKDIRGRAKQSSRKTMDLPAERAPPTVESVEGQIQVLAPLLAEIDHGPSISNNALLAASEQCQQAAAELDAFATDLSNQLQSSKGFKGRCRSLRVVLQKGTLARHEKRVQATMQMLMLALQLTSLCRQNGLIKLQQSQPGIIAAEVISSLAIARSAEESSEAKSQAMGSNPPELGLNKFSTTEVTVLKRMGMFPSTTTIGLEWLTGSIRVQTPDNDTTTEKEQEGHSRETSCLIRVRLPRWLSERALDSFFHKNPISWTHVLIPYHVRGLDSNAGARIRHIMREDSVQELKRSLQSGEVALRDRFVHQRSASAEIPSSFEDCLFSLALGEGAWNIGNYLEEMGLSPEIRIMVSVEWNNHSVGAYSRRDLLQKLDDEFFFNTSLSSFTGTVKEFQVLRRAFWPDSQFFHGSFADTRDEIAGHIILDWEANSIDPFLQREKIRQIIPHPGSIHSGSHLRCLTTKVFGHVERAIGRSTVDRDTSVRDTCAELWVELANAGFTGHCQELLQRIPGQSYEGLRRQPSPGWLLNLLSGISHGLTGFFQESIASERRCTYMRFNTAMNEAIKVYLEMLQTCGVDLASVCGSEVPLWEAQARRWRNGHPIIETCRLTLYYIGLTHGPNPEDWRFFTAENTEAYAGDFWDMVDPSPLWMPGGWVEEDMG